MNSRARRLASCLALMLATACNRDEDCHPEIVLTPAATQGQPYQVRVGDVVELELVQATIFCTPITVFSARWESTDPTVAAITSAGATRPGSGFPARLVAVRPGETTVRAFYTSAGREFEAASSQRVFVVP